MQVCVQSEDHESSATAESRDADEWLAAARAGDFERAWSVSDRVLARARRTMTFGDPSLPRHRQAIWNGTPLEGKRVLVRCYHGLGDTIFCARYLPALRAIAREVLVWAQPSLLPMLKTMRGEGVGGGESGDGGEGLEGGEGGDGVTWLALHDGTPDVAFDVDIESLELPYAFRTTLQTIPMTSPYLHAKPALLTDEGDDDTPARARRTRRIGIAWRAGAWDARRSIPFAQLMPLFDDDGHGDVRWYSLQSAFDARDLPPIADVASWMRAMDLVITIDSMPAHLAGALGCRVWTLLCKDPDWRWLQGRSDSPWYPTMRLFRQTHPGEWRDVIDEVRAALHLCCRP